MRLVKMMLTLSVFTVRQLLLPAPLEVWPERQHAFRSPGQHPADINAYIAALIAAIRSANSS